MVRSQISHTTRIVRDLNELCECYIEELRLGVELITNIDHAGNHEINVCYAAINDNAENCAVHVAEMAHVYVGRVEGLKSKLTINVVENEL